MNISDDDKFAILEWAARHSEIEEVWLYGSRARCDNRPNSDIDLAVKMSMTDWMFWHNKFMGDPDLNLTHEVHVEGYFPEANDKVYPGVKRDGVLLYVRKKF